MSKRIIFYFLTSLVLGCFSFLLFKKAKNPDQLYGYAQKVSRTIQAHEREIYNLTPQLLSSLNSKSSAAKLDLINELFYQDYSLIVYQNDSLIFWNNFNYIIPDSVRLAIDGTKLISLQNSKCVVGTLSKENLDAYFVIPIKYEYPAENTKLKDQFLTDSDIPNNVEVLTNVNSPYKVLDLKNNVLGFLYSDSLVVNQRFEILGIILFSFCLIFFCFVIDRIAFYLANNVRPWLGGVFLLCSIAILRFVSLKLELVNSFTHYYFFQDSLPTKYVGSSLADLLINILLLIWVMVFFNRVFKTKSFAGLKTSLKMTVSFLNYLTILLSIFMITGILKHLVLYSIIDFDFENVFRLDLYSLLAVTGIVVLLFALFLFTHRLMLAIVDIKLPIHQRLSAIFFALLVSVPFLLFANLDISGIQILLFAFIYILLFDIFIDSHSDSFLWLVIWLVVFAASTSMLLYKFNNDKDKINQAKYAKFLSEERDSIAEIKINLIRNIGKQIIERQYVNQSFEKSNDRYITISAELRKLHQEESYLVSNYDLIILENNSPNQQYNSYESKDFERKYKEGASTSFKPIRLWSNEQGNYSYLVKIPIPFDQSEKSNSIALVFKRKKYPEQQKIYNELLIAENSTLENYTQKFEYAIYKNSNQTESNSQYYGQVLNVENLPASDSTSFIVQNDRQELIYNAKNGLIVVVGKKIREFIKPLSLFSYLFALLIILVISFSLLNQGFNLFPKFISFSLPLKPSIKNRFQLSVIGIIMVSFLIIGIVTLLYFRSTTLNYQNKTLKEISTTVLRDAEHEIQLSEQDANFKKDLGSMVRLLSKIHKTEINIYNTDGQLINSSAPNVYTKEIIAPLMNGRAFHALGRQNQTQFTSKESIGDLKFTTSYVALKNKDEVPIAFMGIPYYSHNKDLRNEEALFMGTLLNVYVFLLIIAGLFTIIVAGMMTRPFSVIGDKLKQVKLGKKNQPLEWKTKDEVGALIDEYNRMIAEIDESAIRLAQSEREGAWREMAKQIAHEIKNPLTPMKLSIQHLQKAYKESKRDITPLLNDVTDTLIQQIDNLATIATEFSNFAKMPDAKKEHIELTQLLKSTYDLFSQTDNIQFSYSSEDEDIWVYTDKNLLNQVFNNLVKNAIQAIPEDENGSIDITVNKLNSSATIIIQDNGVGIPSEMQENVFKPYFTTKSSGSGLGLAIAKKIIDSLNGSIDYETSPTGTIFKITLPFGKRK